MLRCTVEGCEAEAKNLSGLASHVRNNHPELDWQEVKQKLQQTAPDKPRLKFEAVPFDDTLTEDMVKRIAKEVVSMMQSQALPDPLPQGAQTAPIEEVEVIGQKINYKIALSPDVFWRFNVFKAQNQRLVAMGKAKQFTGDLGDFLDLSTKTLLSTYGMYPTVLQLSGGKMMVEMPIQEGED